MADDRSLKDVIRFLDPSGDLTDSDIAALTQKLKFTEVLDVVTYVSNDDLDKAREILFKYDQRFAVAKEATVARPIGGGVGAKAGAPNLAKPGSFKKPMGTQPIKPIGTATTTQDDEQDLDQLLTDPSTKNKPEVRQIANLLQRMNK